jgi:hypothetical protein
MQDFHLPTTPWLCTLPGSTMPLSFGRFHCQKKILFMLEEKAHHEDVKGKEFANNTKPTIYQSASAQTQQRFIIHSSCFVDFGFV